MAAVRRQHREGPAVGGDQSLQVLRDPLLGAWRGGVYEGVRRAVEPLHRLAVLLPGFHLAVVDLVVTDTPAQGAPGAGVAADDLIAQILRRDGRLHGHDPAIIGENHRREIGLLIHGAPI